MVSVFDEPHAAVYNRIPRKEVPEGKKQVADFIFKKTIGEGSFSIVLSVEEKSSAMPFAMKIIDKSQVRKQQFSKQVMREKDILSSLDHPFILKLYCTFQTETQLFFCLTLAKNGCLLDFIIKYGSFSVDVTRFYIAEIVHVLQHLHSKEILHRDVKPENILLDDNMHILLSDFGTAIKLTSSNQRPKSFVGTPQYVSPEILQSKDMYACKESDLWAVGCMWFQFISGTTPFSGPKHQYAIFQKILKCEYDFEEGFPKDEKDFVERLLVLNPEERLGSSVKGGLNELKKHTIFEGIIWETLHQQTPPKITPYLPKSGSFSLEEFETLNLEAPKKLVDDRQSFLSKQAQEFPKLHKHLNGNEIIIKEGIVHKRRGLSRKKRHLILTDYPSLYYIDPATNQLKGQISWDNGIKPQQKSRKIFFVHTAERIYYLECSENKADSWCNAIEDVITKVKTRQSTNK